MRAQERERKIMWKKFFFVTCAPERKREGRGKRKTEEEKEEKIERRKERGEDGIPSSPLRTHDMLGSEVDKPLKILIKTSNVA